MGIMNENVLNSTRAIDASRKSLQVRDCRHPEFERLWRAFLAGYPVYTVRYDLDVFRYHLVTLSARHQDLSFVVVNSTGIPLCICPLVIEQVEENRVASLADLRPLPVPLMHCGLSARQRRGVENYAYEKAMQLLMEVEAKSWHMEAEIMSVGADLVEDLFPARFGAMDVSSYQHIVDLRVSEDQLWQATRKRARPDINAGMSEYEFRVYDSSTYSDEVGLRHKAMHHKVAGRVTRPEETFFEMYRWIRSGCGLMFEQIHGGASVMLTCVCLGKHTAVGASTANEPTFVPPVPQMHSMTWFILKECRKRGVWFYEMGETPWRSTLFQILSEKEANIAYFKRGFGNRTVPVKRWILFASLEEEARYLERKMAEYNTHQMGRAARSWKMK
jgi:hypothetical protein